MENQGDIATSEPTRKSQTPGSDFDIEDLFSDSDEDRGSETESSFSGFESDEENRNYGHRTFSKLRVNRVKKKTLKQARVNHRDSNASKCVRCESNKDPASGDIINSHLAIPVFQELVSTSVKPSSEFCLVRIGDILPGHNILERDQHKMECKVDRTALHSTATLVPVHCPFMTSSLLSQETCSQSASISKTRSPDEHTPIEPQLQCYNIVNDNFLNISSAADGDQYQGSIISGACCLQGDHIPLTSDQVISQSCTTNFCCNGNRSENTNTVVTVCCCSPALSTITPPESLSPVNTPVLCDVEDVAAVEEIEGEKDCTENCDTSSYWTSEHDYCAPHPGWSEVFTPDGRESPSDNIALAAKCNSSDPEMGENNTLDGLPLCSEAEAAQIMLDLFYSRKSVADAPTRHTDFCQEIEPTVMSSMPESPEEIEPSQHDRTVSGIGVPVEPSQHDKTVSGISVPVENRLHEYTDKTNFNEVNELQSMEPDSTVADLSCDGISDPHNSIEKEREEDSVVEMTQESLDSVTPTSDKILNETCERQGQKNLLAMNAKNKKKVLDRQVKERTKNTKLNRKRHKSCFSEQRVSKEIGSDHCFAEGLSVKEPLAFEETENHLCNIQFGQKVPIINSTDTEERSGKDSNLSFTTDAIIIDNEDILRTQFPDGISYPYDPNMLFHALGLVKRCSMLKSCASGFPVSSIAHRTRNITKYLREIKECFVVLEDCGKMIGKKNSLPIDVPILEGSQNAEEDFMDRSIHSPTQSIDFEGFDFQAENSSLEKHDGSLLKPESEPSSVEGFSMQESRYTFRERKGGIADTADKAAKVMDLCDRKVSILQEEAKRDLEKDTRRIRDTGCNDQVGSAATELEEKNINCDSRSKNGYIHYSNSKKEKSEICVMCGKSFRTQLRLKKHLTKVHRQSNDVKPNDKASCSRTSSICNSSETECRLDTNQNPDCLKDLIGGDPGVNAIGLSNVICDENVRLFGKGARILSVITHESCEKKDDVLDSGYTKTSKSFPDLCQKNKLNLLECTKGERYLSDSTSVAIDGKAPVNPTLSESSCVNLGLSGERVIAKHLRKRKSQYPGSDQALYLKKKRILSDFMANEDLSLQDRDGEQLHDCDEKDVKIGLVCSPDGLLNQEGCPSEESQEDPLLEEKANISIDEKAQLEGKENSVATVNNALGVCKKEEKAVVRRRKKHLTVIIQGKKWYPCSVCQHKCSSSGDLTRHMRKHTGERPYQCPECPSSFKQVSALKKHSEVHKGNRPYCCKLCNSRFRQKVHLKTHLRIHTGERPYVCDECGKAFSQMDHLKDHINTHTMERPHRCKVCNRGFKSCANLSKHKRIHDVNKRYKCHLCPAAFVAAQSLKVHNRIHTGEKPIHCPVCNTDFRFENNLRKHVTAKHPEFEVKGVTLVPRARK